MNGKKGNNNNKLNIKTRVRTDANNLFNGMLP